MPCARAQTIQTMLGSWTKASTGGADSSSGMISNIAKQDLAESVQAFNTHYSDTGLFGVYAVAGQYDLDNLIHEITHAMTGLAYNVDENLLNEAKNQLKISMLSQLDGSTVICEEIGRQMLTYGRRMHATEVIARIDAVDAEAVKATANRCARGECAWRVG